MAGVPSNRPFWRDNMDQLGGLARTRQLAARTLLPLLILFAFAPRPATACSYMRQNQPGGPSSYGVINLDNPAARWEEVLEALGGGEAAHVSRRLLQLPTPTPPAPQAPIRGTYRGQSGGIPNKTAGEDVSKITRFGPRYRVTMRPYPNVTLTGLQRWFGPVHYSAAQRTCIVNAATAKVKDIHNNTAAEERGYHAANWLRLVFHDCAGGNVTVETVSNNVSRLVAVTGGCDASLLLAPEEIRTTFNFNLQDFNDIISIKFYIDKACGFYVSVADTLQLAAAIMMQLRGAPNMVDGVTLGHADNGFPNDSNHIPHATDNLATVLRKFKETLGPNGTLEDMVALMGGHTFGEMRCGFLMDRLRPQWDRFMNNATLQRLLWPCRWMFDDQGRVNNNLTFTDALPEIAFDGTRLDFDNNIFQFMGSGTGLLIADHMFNGVDDGSGVPAATQAALGMAVARFRNDLPAFSSAFVRAFQRLGRAGVPPIG